MYLEHYDIALDIFKNMERIFKKHDRISEVSYKIGVLYRNKGEIKESNNIFKTIINKYPESSVANIANKILNN
jgi:TolA-binding protein